MIDIEKHKLFKSEERIHKLLSVLEKRQNDITVVMENINDPHNVAAAMRSCDAVGISKIQLIYTGKQPIPKLRTKSGSSADKWVETELFTSVEDCFDELKSKGFSIYTTHMASDSVSLYDLDFTKKTALVFGNEHSGVSNEALSLADGNFLIPQVGMIQSLNISVAVAVSLYEVFRQRDKMKLYSKPNYSESELDEKLMEWVRK
jgi:tRNA (guanosine-2'-O-)-methyltransferase